jgi:hypothetical protein
MRYAVTFYNDLLDSHGMEHKVCQRKVEVDYSGHEEIAIEKAKEEFCNLEGVSNLHDRAQYYEVEVVHETTPSSNGQS